MADDKDFFEVDLLFAGATRPAMMFGVTFDYLIISGMVTAMFFLGTGNLLYMLMIVPMHALGVLVCANDPRNITVFISWMTVMAKCRNRMFWGSSTYIP